MKIHGDENEHVSAEEMNKESSCYEKRYEKCYEKCKHVVLKNENQNSGTASAPAPASDVCNVRDVRVQKMKYFEKMQRNISMRSLGTWRKC